ncbi:hypothetical protein PN492_16225 [Dolichospermum circinale CS-537/01]|uniref:Uncharacterized protein n=1 Tax=Dolichospermum circinale CS-537/01 TaxID=3021739 RepID=A0ABT5A800_9CYAN|nr:hypothetical protein [Dolichospermum circinale]MDB9488075.1 hypothetical protein [Dolichospermum circinale CS-537/01]
MLKTRNLIFTLSLSPLLSFAWQLPNQAQSSSPSKGTAGVDAGAATGASQTSGFSTPTGTTQGTTQATTTEGTPVIIPIISGVSATVTSGVSTDGKLSLATTTGGDTTATVAVTAATVESTSSSLTVTDGATRNTVVITLAPQIQVVVNQLAAAIIQNFNSIITGDTTDGTTGGGAADVGALLTGGAGAQQAAVALTNSFTAAGISPQLATALVTSLTGLFGGSTTGSLPNQPVAMTTSGQLVASTKAFKPVTIIAQGSAGISVNINKLNDAIVAYNGIILQSEPKAVKNLSRNGGFVGIGGILKQLRTAVK